MERIADQDFMCGPLLPESNQKKTVFEDKAVRVERMLDDPNFENQATVHRGPAGLSAAARDVAAIFQDAVDVRSKFKLVRLELSDHDISTRQLVTISGRTATGVLEQHATWLAKWTKGSGDELPSLLRIEVQQFEQVTSRSTLGPLFVDGTASILGKNDSFQQQLLFGMNHWLQRIQDTRYFTPLGNPGLALGDVNGDELDDLYICQEAGLPNRLFLQSPNGSADEAAAAD